MKDTDAVIEFVHHWLCLKHKKMTTVEEEIVDLIFKKWLAIKLILQKAEDFLHHQNHLEDLIVMQKAVNLSGSLLNMSCLKVLHHISI